MKKIIAVLAVVLFALSVFYYQFNKVEDNVVVLNETNFVESVSKGVSVVDFYADWCGPCRRVAPIMAELDVELEDVNVFKVDVDASGNLATEFNISSIPQVIFLKDGKEISRFVGLRSKEDYVNEIARIKSGV